MSDGIVATLHSLYTIGYAYRGTREILDTFVQQGGQIVDARLSTFTKVSGFSTREMQERYQESYRHVLPLGNVNHSLQGADIKLKEETQGINILEKTLQVSPVCLLCGCLAVIGCHRLYIALCIAKRQPGREIIHLAQTGIDGMIKHPASIRLLGEKCAYMENGKYCPGDKDDACQKCYKPICNAHAYPISNLFTEGHVNYCPICYAQHERQTTY